MAEYCRIANEFEEKADFLVVYIEEAHAAGEFDFSENFYQIGKHGSLSSDRMAAAEQMIADLDGKIKCPVLVDAMNNEAMNAYGARPERMYIILDGKIAYQGARGPMYNDMAEFKQHLEELCK
jgi:type I thyroxine 5'-deiodinase